MSRQIQYRAGRTGTRIRGAVHQARNPGMDQRPHAHRAGFQRDIQGTARQPVVAHPGAGHSQHPDLRVGAGVVLGDGAIPCRSQQFTLLHQHGPHRHLAGGLGGARLLQRQAHPAFVFTLYFHTMRPVAARVVISKP